MEGASEAMAVIFLIRHAENDFVKNGVLAGRLQGVHLNENGKKQAQVLAQSLSRAPVKAIYSSPLDRALETAAPLAQMLGLPVEQRPALLELDVGEWKGMALKVLRRSKTWKNVIATPSRVGFPGGETFAQAQLRIANELESLAGSYKPKDLLVCVTHADLIKLAVAYFIGMPLDMFQRLSVAPASITTLWLGEGSAKLLKLNYEPTLDFRKK